MDYGCRFQLYVRLAYKAIQVGTIINIKLSLLTIPFSLFISSDEQRTVKFLL